MTLKLPEVDFYQVVRSTPLVSIDLVVTDGNGRYLLGKRRNRPAKGYWFVPGGRILKDEKIATAFKRLTEEELGICFSENDAKFIGVCEHFYDDNFSGVDYTTHYVVLGYMLVADIDIENIPKTQHNQYEWFSKLSLLNSESVHVHTKWYLEKQ